MIEVILQDQRSGHLVEPPLALAPVRLAHREQRFCFMARQPFVLKHDGERRARTEERGQRAHAGRLIGGIAIEPPRQTDDDDVHAIRVAVERGEFRGNSARGTIEIRVVDERLPRRRQETRGVRQRESNAPLAVIDPEGSHTDRVPSYNLDIP